MRDGGVVVRVLLSAGLALGVVDVAAGYVSVDTENEQVSRRYEPDVAPIVEAPPLDYRLLGSRYGCNYWMAFDNNDEAVVWPALAFGPAHWGNGCLSGTGQSWEQAWAAWYYQERFSTDGTVCSGYLPLDDTPLYMSELTSYGHYLNQLGWPEPPTYRAEFVPVGGMGYLKVVPLEATSSPLPVVASARYRIEIKGAPTPLRKDPPGTTWPGVYSSAMFYLTAAYDESLFDVTVDGQYRWCYSVLEYAAPPAYGSFWLYARGQHLGCSRPLLFTAEDYATFGRAAPPGYEEQFGANQVGKRDEFWQVPEYVTVRLRPNRTLDEAKGRTVTLLLHSVTHAEPYHNADPNWNGDTLSVKRTGYVRIGLDDRCEEWRIEPPPLKDECVPPAFEDLDQQAAQADILGASIMNSLNVELPSMRVGHNRFRVGRTLSETLGNEAVYEAIWTKSQYPLAPGLPPLEWVDHSFVRVNVQGVWFAVGVAPPGSNEFCDVGDVPGWWAEWDMLPDGSLRLNVYDAYSNLVYRFLTDKKPGRTPTDPLDIIDYAFRPAKMVQVDQASSGNRVRTYQYGDDSRTTLIRQVDSAGNQITYSFDGTTNELTVVGNGTRTIRAFFVPPSPDIPEYSLQSASWGEGSAWRRYEWIPMHTPVRPNDGKLASIRDASGTYLTYLQYEAVTGPASRYSRGRLTKVSRGPADDPEEEVVATFDWTDPTYVFDGNASSPPDLEGSTMEARFHVDSGSYERICRLFDSEGRLERIDQYQKLCPAIGDNPVATTRFEYHALEDVVPPQAPPTPGLFWQEIPQYAFTPDGWVQVESYLMPRCTTKVLPGGQAAEHTQYDALHDRNVLQILLAPYQGTNVEPPVTDWRNWIGFEYARFPDSLAGRWQKTTQIEHSRGGARTDYVYDSQGFLTQRIYPAMQTADGGTIRPVETCDYHSTGSTEFPHDYRQTDAASRNTVATTYECDGYGYPTKRADSAGGISLTYGYMFNVFGQKCKEVDAEGYVHWTEYDPVTGLMTGTCTSEAKHASSAVGNVVCQTKYLYSNGMLQTIRVADSPGPFPKDNPERWIETTFAYDAYGRLLSKTVRDPVSLAALTTQYRFDRQDRLVLAVWPDGRWKRITRDGQGRIRMIEYGNGDPDASGTVLLKSTYEYDIAGNLVRRTTEGCPKCGHDTEYQYDVYNRRTAEIRHEVTQ